ncbi:MAG: protein translocase subunit SecD [Candidatus Niyogibacteria bacterium CG10_big_fil_rev_8_21_14_0_10_46_36]|uniref:Protein translocase subunit SecD n=1 Tax=Candidatus Niyogibacteria bacterium CG10_big_fil_rev_8_21_14_0_10_46_36 TaxID=1974726 RepID=A0A2H0TEM3_9BACT|nr:MAG: protein translocase subunit SecD [Candidatus Niyogibacteria bacterium CG10_big_fil_rev_8_21_14_0_10_46_36]
MKSQLAIRIGAVILLLLGVCLGYINISPFIGGAFQDVVPFKLGLDLQGGTHLVYRADTSVLGGRNIDEAMAGLRDVVERRVNFFGVTEPLVQVQQSGDEQRLIVELAGVFDIGQAIQIIGQTPFLEFRTERPEEEAKQMLADLGIQEGEPIPAGTAIPDDLFYLHTDLTGRYLKEATILFGDGQSSLGPSVGLQFNDDGAEIFRQLTRDNVGKTIAIYLDGVPISTPVVQGEISGGQAQITGNFTAEEVRDLVRNLNSGALPLPIELISQQNVGPSLGASALAKGVNAGAYALIAVALFLLLWYRLPGLIGIFSIAFYTIVLLFLFKLFGVTLTTAGIAGFILSVGMAVDANILIFERIKEEVRRGQQLDIGVKEGFWRAWPSIRDANISTLITSTILFWFGTSIIKGFALTLGIGVFASLTSAFLVTRTFLLAVGFRNKAISSFLYGSGIK